MCESCGCGPHGAETIIVRENLLAANDRVAAHVRRHFDAHRVLAINLMSSPGAGKTSLLEATIAALPPGIRVAVIEGDLETENDAERIRRHGVKAVQITTGVACHLDATMVHDALDEISFDDVDILFIENVGNLVCPADFDIGQHRNVVLLSVTEGDDKPEKYPVIFRNADLVLITKTDLLPYMDDFDMGRALGAVGRLRGGERARKFRPRRSAASRVGWIGLRLSSPPNAKLCRRRSPECPPRATQACAPCHDGVVLRFPSGRHRRPGRSGRRRRSGAARRSVWPRHHLRPVVGDRPLQFPLRLLHGGRDEIPAARRGASPRGAGSAVLDLRRPGREEDPADWRRPLVRRGVMNLVQSLSRRLKANELDELTLTTNGSQLARYAGDLAACGVKRVNVSLDTLDAAQFAAISRHGMLADVLAGIDAADRAGLKVKINAVAQKGLTEDSAVSLVCWAHGQGYDLTFIEVMPLGDVEGEWSQRFLSLGDLRAQLAAV